jgi:hypothetical protein
MSWKRRHAAYPHASCQENNERLKKLIGFDYRKGIYTLCQTILNFTASFLLGKFCSSNIDVRKLNYQFIIDFEFWL